MSFDDSLKRERGPSIFALFEFSLAENVQYRYTDSEEEVFHEGNVFTPEPITYSEVVADGTLKKATLTVESRYSLPPAKIFRIDPPSFVTTLAIWEGNFDDRDREIRKLWQGRVLNSKTENRKAIFTCEPQSTSLARPGLRRNYQKPCPHALYGDLCKAVRTEEPVTWVSGNTNQWIVSKPSGFVEAARYEGGLVSWLDTEGFTRFQTILSVTDNGGDITLGVNRAVSPSSAPQQIKIVKGCNHTEDACSNWHGNIVNYGGCPFIPLDNPINKFSTYY